jgi:hypothetical protein
MPQGPMRRQKGLAAATPPARQLPGQDTGQDSRQDSCRGTSAVPSAAQFGCGAAQSPRLCNTWPTGSTAGVGAAAAGRGPF